MIHTLLISLDDKIDVWIRNLLREIDRASHGDRILVGTKELIVSPGSVDQRPVDPLCSLNS